MLHKRYTKYTVYGMRKGDTLGPRIAIRVNGQERLWGINKSTDYYEKLKAKGDDVTDEERRERHWLWCVLKYWPNKVHDENAEYELERQHMKHEFTKDKYPDEGEYDEHGIPQWQ